jgi:PLAC8 family
MQGRSVYPTFRMIFLLQILVLVSLWVAVMSQTPIFHHGVSAKAVALLFLVRAVFFAVGVTMIWKERSVKRGVMAVFVLVSVLWLYKMLMGLESLKGGTVQFHVTEYLYELACYSFCTFTVMITRNARRSIRDRYNIHPILFSSSESEAEPNSEDCLLSWCCSCCTTAQMLRHTADYRKHGSSWCSDRGVPYGTPAIL